MLIPFARQSKNSDASIGYSGERLKNYFLRPGDGVSQGVLVGASGSVAKYEPGGKVRALVENAGALFVISGGVVWKTVGGALVNVGAVADGPDTFAVSDGRNIAIVAQGRYFVCDGTATAEYATGSVDVPRGVSYQDGYFIVIGDSAGRTDGFTVSALDDPTTFNGLDMAFAESSPDRLRGVISDHGELWLFGSRTIEVWYNSGASGFPFSRNNGALMEKGCLSGLTIAKKDNAVFWVGDDKIVYRSAGTSPQVISSREIEEKLSKSTIENAFTFQDRGHLFYAIRITNGTTLCYDMTVGVWCERSTGTEDGPWIATCRATVDGVDHFGTATGKVITLDPGSHTDDGAPLVAEAVSIPTDKGGNSFSVNRIHLNVRGGVGDLGRNPRVMLQTTKDGRNWGVERWRDVGGRGIYYNRTTWHGMGTFRRFQMKVRISDPVPRDIYGAQYE